MRWLFYIIMLLLCPLLLYAEEPQDSGPKTHWNFGVHISARNSPGNQLSGFPERIRDVPIHEDDGRLIGNLFMEQPMPDTLLVLDKPTAFELQATVNPTPMLIFGAVLTLRRAEAGVNTDRRYQQNQSGSSSRSYGTSLRWYETGVKGEQIGLLAMATTPWQNFGQYIRVRLTGGGIYDLTGMRMVARAGWDRWNRDEGWDDEVLAVLYEHRLQYGLELGLTNVQLDEKSPLRELISIQILYTKPIDRFDVRANELQYQDPKNASKWLLVVGARFR